MSEMTTAAAAERLDVHPSTVRRWADLGLLPARKVGRDWLIAEQGLAGFTRPRPGPRRRSRQRETVHVPG